ncbi:hypothetical protein [Actinoplanes subglobosus]|uniref:Uncharacterized protein n=1 Tax=Actinoplanes subglobosus TaxID=1547892 RepID=A0ABV8J4L8_9ACTN
MPEALAIGLVIVVLAGLHVLAWFLSEQAGWLAAVGLVLAWIVSILIMMAISTAASSGNRVQPIRTPPATHHYTYPR